MFSSPLVRLFAGQKRVQVRKGLHAFFLKWGQTPFAGKRCRTPKRRRPCEACPHLLANQECPHFQCNGVRRPDADTAPRVRRMRILTILISLAICAAAGAASQRDVQKAANDDQLLANAGIEPAAAELRLPCAAAVLDTDDAPSAFNAVCVQTRHELNFFSLEDGYLMSELQLTLSNMDGVALQRRGRYSQV